MLDRFDTISFYLSKIIHDIGSQIIYPVLAIIVFANVALRYFFNYPLSWAEEVEGYLLFTALFLSMTYTWDKNAHVRMEMVYDAMSGKMKHFANIVASICGILLFGIMGIQSVIELPYMIKTNEGGRDIDFPHWPFRFIVIIAVIIFIMRSLVYIFRGRER